MNCLHPIRLRPDSKMLIPCRRCMACRIQHTREWAVRLMHELEYHSKACFTTLTYDNDHLPEAGGLVKKDLQLFFKRLRRRDMSFRYFACGEYGGLFKRPHYHIIFFGQDFKKRGDPVLLEAWNYGFNSTGTVTYDSCRYVAGYCIDKLTGPMALEVYGDREPPFQLQSKGLGREWCDEFADQLKDGKEFTLQGRPIGMPAYYARRLDFKDTYRAAKKSMSHHEDVMEHVDIGLEQMALRRYEAARIDVLSRDQDGHNLEARQRLYGRNK